MDSPSVIVQKYGGSSVADVARLRQVAGHAVACKRAGHAVVVVVSAMGKTTDGLLAQAREVSPNPDRRELDMLLSVGERISMSLLAMAIRDLGEVAISLTGSQSGIITNDRHSDARIIEVRPVRVEDELHRGNIVIVAGYQGMSYRREITTLGRGGTDTTAVALAAALGALRCEIYSDVDGVYTADPRAVPNATRLETLGQLEMQELAEAGARVLNAQAVEWARRAGIRIYARKTGDPSPGTVVALDAPQPASGVRAVASRARVLWLDVHNATPAAVLETLDHHHAAADQLGVLDGGTRVLAALPLENLHGVQDLRDALHSLAGATVHTDVDTGLVSLVGQGLCTRSDVALKALETLRMQGIAVHQMFVSALRVALAVPGAQVDQAVAALHRGFLEGQPVTPPAQRTSLG